jgi:hypothetical protein
VASRQGTTFSLTDKSLSLISRGTLVREGTYADFSPHFFRIVLFGHQFVNAD